MPLEVATLIHQLNPENPAGGDPIASGDDHIRLIKTSLKNTFPNVTEPVTGSAYELGGWVPVGGIIMWSGVTAPSGWRICDGQNGAPDLRGKFVYGATTDEPVGTVGGNITKTSGASGAHSHGTTQAGAHSHTGATQGHALTIAQMPQHNHPGVTLRGLNEGAQVIDGFDGGTWFDAVQGSGFSGGSQAHSHGISSDGAHSHTTTTVGDHSHIVNVIPPFYALAFIQRIAQPT